jgi:hypothetical protein
MDWGGGFGGGLTRTGLGCKGGLLVQRVQAPWKASKLRLIRMIGGEAEIVVGLGPRGPYVGAGGDAGGSGWREHMPAPSWRHAALRSYPCLLYRLLAVASAARVRSLGGDASARVWD